MWLPGYALCGAVTANPPGPPVACLLSLRRGPFCEVEILYLC